MKNKILRLRPVFLSVFMITMFSGCAFLFPEYGNASVNAVIPDYYRSADGQNLCKLDAEKTEVKLTYYNSKTKEFKTHKTLKLSDVSKTSVLGTQDMPALPACIYTFEFKDLPANTFDPDKIRIELYEENGYQIDCYSNSYQQTINCLYCQYFTAFSNRDLQDELTHDLLPIEIRVHRKSLQRGKSYTFKINSDKADAAVLADRSGRIRDYFTNSDIAQNKADFSSYTNDQIFYLAVWNPINEMTEYKIEFIEK